MSESEEGSRRTYRSRVRDEQAARTRAAITHAARELFERQGFGGTTVAAIAARAGVSAQTVYGAFGSKAGVVRALVTQMEESAEAALWAERMAAETDPARLLAAFAQWTCAFFEASRPTFDLATEAMAELTDVMEEGDRRRRDGVMALVERIDARGGLRPGLGVQRAADQVWLLTGVHTFMGATQGCGWDADTYAEWLTATLIGQILDAPG